MLKYWEQKPTTVNKSITTTLTLHNTKLEDFTFEYEKNGPPLLYGLPLFSGQDILFNCGTASPRDHSLCDGIEQFWKAPSQWRNFVWQSEAFVPTDSLYLLYGLQRLSVGGWARPRFAPLPRAQGNWTECGHPFPKQFKCGRNH